MLRRFAGATLFLLLAWSGGAQALGLGDIRLQSALNEPFRAEIDLLSATPEELRGLTVQLAPSATFERYGIDRPSFLGNFRFEVRSLPGNRGMVVVSSSQPVTEPFVTFLAEAVWPRGRLLREYTVLLDPPVFTSEQKMEAPVQAPAPAAPVDRSAGSGVIRRAPETRPSTPAPLGGDTYRVQRSDTLWGIAERVRPPGSGLTMNQVMLALYENNREAFDGNINLLREGAVLRIPSDDVIFGINRSDAIAEVSRQNRAWSGSDVGSLRLVPPDEEPQTAATPAAGTAEPGRPGTAPADEARIRRLESDIAERDRLLAVKDRELAALREQLAAREAAGEQAPAPTETEMPATTPGVDLEAEAEGEAADDEIFAESGAEGTPTEAGEEVLPEAVTPGTEEPVAEQTPARTPAAVTTPRQPEGGLMQTVSGLLGSIWTYVGLGVVLVALLLLALVRRRRTEADDSTGTWEALDTDFEDEEEREATERLRALASEDDSILVVEKDEATSGRAAAAAGAGAAAGVAAAAGAGEEADTEASGIRSFEDTFSSETALNLDQSDPLAEADFHMAYGLYDQAADLMRNAIAADPGRTDLKAKLAEVYFVWGNKEAFVDAAQNLHEALGGNKDSDWDRIVIMGQQIAPDHQLFVGASASGGAEMDLPLDEESGVGTLDVDFGADEQSEAVDISFGADEETGDVGLDEGADGLDFILDDTGERSATNEMLLDADAMTDSDFDQESETAEALYDEPTQESPTMEAPWDEAETQESPTLETAYDEDTQESPTLETPAADEEATMELPAAPSDDEARRSEETAEIDLDDLGLDLEGLAASGERSATVLHIRGEGETEEDFDDIAGETEVLGDEEATMLAPGTADIEELIGDDEATTLASSADYAFDETELLPEDESASATEATGEMPALGAEKPDVDLEDLTAAIESSDLGDLDTPGDTVEQPASGSETERFRADVFDDEDLDSILDLDVGEDLAEEGDAGPTVLQPAGGEGRTQTEVGTKLDLARAYVDMGDPDGARSILQEVLEEGDEGQRQEANRLLDALPG